MDEIVNEVEIHISGDGLTRAAIVKRPDNLFCIFRHTKFSSETLRLWNVVPNPNVAATWFDDTTPQSLLYDEQHAPLIGVYGTVEDARREIRNWPAFTDQTFARVRFRAP